MTQLKNCPCCGSMDIKHDNFGYQKHTVSCHTCVLSTDYYLDDEEAAEAWNTRPLEDAMQTKLDIAVEAMQYALNDPYVGFGAYYTKKKLQEALKRLEENNVQR